MKPKRQDEETSTVSPIGRDAREHRPLCFFPSSSTFLDESAAPLFLLLSLSLLHAKGTTKNTSLAPCVPALKALRAEKQKQNKNKGEENASLSLSKTLGRSGFSLAALL
jgi:hypothetical protein